MVPSSSTTRSGSTRTRRTRKPRTRQYKKRLAIVKTEKKKAAEQGSSTSSDCFSKNMGGGFDFKGVDVDDDIPESPCSTPKAQRFRIPEIETCPPAPKKQRVLSNCSFHRKPIAFFASPDLELFFCFALRDISV
ncbi:hypothetical protein SLA2020_502900 [Shorea laevis]